MAKFSATLSLVLVFVCAFSGVSSASSLEKSQSYAVSTIAQASVYGAVFAGIAPLPSGDFVVSDNKHHLLYILPAGPRAGKPMTVFAGKSAMAGHVDGPAASATFNRPTSLATDSRGNIYIADVGNYLIRMYVNATDEVKTIAGTLGKAGVVDGPGSAAVFSNDISDLAYLAASCSLLVVDRSTGRIRTIVVDDECAAPTMATNTM